MRSMMHFYDLSQTVTQTTRPLDLSHNRISLKKYVLFFLEAIEKKKKKLVTSLNIRKKTSFRGSNLLICD